MSESVVYIAKEPLYVGTARAHNPGDVVPAENVKRNGWESLVERRKTAEPSDSK